MPFLRSTGTLGAGLLAAILAAFSLGGEAGAQAPTSPRDAATCTGTLTLAWGTLFDTPVLEMQYTVSGLEPDAPYTLFVGGQAAVSASTNSAGTASGSFTVLAQSASPNIQVATAGRCAAATLPRLPLQACLAFMPTRTFACPFIVTPDGILPVVIGPGGTPIVGP
jgi:hypothetical protein